MRPFKYSHSHLWFDLPKLVETRNPDKSILLRLYIQDGHSHPAHLWTDLTCEHTPEPCS